MEEIINSVMQSPENTNPNVLRSQLQNIGEDSGGSGGALVVTVTPAENGANNGGTKGAISGGDEPIYIADKTVAEIKAGLLAGNVVVQFVNCEFFSANSVYVVAFIEWRDKDSSWAVGARSLDTSFLLTAESVDDHPQLEI